MAKYMLIMRGTDESVAKMMETPFELLVNWCYDRSQARLGRGDRRGSSHLRLPTCGLGVAHIWHASCRSPWRGEAQEGSAQLEVALPSSLGSAHLSEEVRRAAGHHRDGPA
jgi:hypothetical protein